MKRLIFAIVLYYTISCMSAYADYIFHADGSIFEAKIVSQTATSVTVQRGKKKPETIKGSDILRIREKPVIRKGLRIFDMDRGMFFAAHQVDESPLSYTFRMDMASPDEYKIRREKVLLMAHPLSIDLKLSPGGHELSLSWEAVPNAVRYVVGVTSVAGRYEYIVETDKPSAVVRGLKGNSKYRVMVCAQDKDQLGYGPVKDVEFVTLNNPPDAPASLRLSSDPMGLHLSWQKARDEDGIVRYYRIFEKTGEQFTQIGLTEKTEFTVRSGDLSAMRIFAVRSVDEKYGASELSAPVKTREHRTYLYKCEFIYAYPLGVFASDLTYGKGVMISGERQKIFMPEIGLSVSGGALMFSGEGKASGDLFPLTAEGRYSYAYGPVLQLYGSCAMGAAYYGGKETDGTGFSHTGFISFIRAGAEMKKPQFSLSAQLLWGGFYMSKGFGYFFGASLAAGAAVDF